MPSDPPPGDQQQQSRQPESGQNPQPPPPNGNPPAPDCPPAPAMGLPPQMGYPAGPYPPHYPNPYNQPQYPYAQTPLPGPAYYGQPQGLYEYDTRPPPRFGSCICCFISFFIFFVIVLSFSNLITWITLRAQIPIFRIESMTVSNFNTSTPFTANWDAQLDVDNTKKSLTVYFDTIETAVVSDGDYRLGQGFVIPFFVDKKSETKVPVSVSANGSASDPVSIWVAQSIEKEQNEKGMVEFILVFGVKTMIRGWFTRHVSLKIA